jgi:hypothetical protein
MELNKSLKDFNKIENKIIVKENNFLKKLKKIIIIFIYFLTIYENIKHKFSIIIIKIDKNIIPI